MSNNIIEILASDVKFFKGFLTIDEVGKILRLMNDAGHKDEASGEAYWLWETENYILKVDILRDFRLQSTKYYLTYQRK